MNMSDDKVQALEMAMSHIEKQFGKGSIMKLGGTKIMDIEVIPTGCLALDIALGVGGVPRGRVMEIYGPESSGKTTVALHIVAEAQKRGGAAAFIDAEFDIMYNEGIPKEGNLIDIAVNEGFVQKVGAWFSYKDTRLGQGRENSKQYLRDNPDLALEIENLIRGKYSLPSVKIVINEDQAVENLKKRE